ncbi:hypothetical protein [Novosphingobium rosa]|nr:hypothetical protein [Novosphingobium rosa]
MRRVIGVFLFLDGFWPSGTAEHDSVWRAALLFGGCLLLAADKIAEGKKE